MSTATIASVNEHLTRLEGSVEAVAPGTLAQIIQLFISAEPAEIAVLTALFPNNPIVLAVTTALPRLDALLQKLVAILATIPTPTPAQ